MTKRTGMDSFTARRGVARRELLLAGLAGAVAGTATTTRAATQGPALGGHVAPGLEFVFEVAAQLGPPMELGSAGGITRRYIPILGGTVSGPRFKGRVLGGGNDTQRIHPGGRTEILARYLIQADDAAVVQVTNPGVRRAPPEIMKRLVAGELVDPSLYYFRTTPSFETTAATYAWMQESVFVCVGIRRPDSVSLRFFAVL